MLLIDEVRADERFAFTELRLLSSAELIHFPYSAITMVCVRSILTTVLAGDNRLASRLQEAFEFSGPPLETLGLGAMKASGEANHAVPDGTARYWHLFQALRARRRSIVPTGRSLLKRRAKSTHAELWSPSLRSRRAFQP